MPKELGNLLYPEREKITGTVNLPSWEQRSGKDKLEGLEKNLENNFAPE